MTEDQILQRIAENQKRVFEDIDRSKSRQTTQPFQIVGANGLNVQQQGNQIAIEADPSALQGPRGERGVDGASGVDGPEGKEGETGPKGSDGEEGEKGEQGEEGEKGEQGEEGEKGDEGEQGVGVESVSVGQNLSFSFTLTDGSQITTEPLVSGDGLLYVVNGELTLLPISNGLLTGTDGELSWTETEACN
jgi:hypothetical protein